MRFLRAIQITKKSVRSYSSLQTSFINANKFERRSNFLLIQSRNFSIVEIWKTISNSAPVAFMQDNLVQFHDLTGLSWSGSIILSTVLLRSVVTLPFAIYQNKITTKIELLTLEIPDIVKELKKETAMAIKKFGWTEKQARVVYNKSLRQQWNNLIVRDNCHPAKTMILLWFQIPLWICQSVAIRNLVLMLPNPNSLEAKITFTEMTIGGFGWIPNLTEVDSSLILPVFLGLLNLSIIEVQSMMRVRPPTKFQKYITNFFRLFSIVMIPIAAQVPSCLCLYWVSSSAYGLVQNLVLLSPKFKRILKIPKTQSEIDQPYQHLINNIKSRIKTLTSPFN